jgi:DNA ligase N terminus
MFQGTALTVVAAVFSVDDGLIFTNLYRSVMVLTPDDLLPSVYMCLNRIAPAYEGKELGIGDMVLMKAIAQTTGRYQYYATFCSPSV